MKEQHLYYTDRVRTVRADEIQGGTSIMCPNCGNRHGLFYRRHDKDTRTLHFFCNKVKRRWMENQPPKPPHECWHYVIKMCEVEYADNLSIKEEWTIKHKDTFQKEHTADLLK